MRLLSEQEIGEGGTQAVAACTNTPLAAHENARHPTKAHPTKDRRMTRMTPMTILASRPLMRRQFLAQTAVALALPVVVLGCSSSHPLYRYKMVVEVDTPQGLRLGESVR
jgi:hypothetical protein